MMGVEFDFLDKIPVAVLGATGSVGQRFVELLSHHPWFDLTTLAASERSVGKRYKDAVNGNFQFSLPEWVAELTISSCKPPLSENIIFSALDSSIATEVEASFANAGHTVISTAKNYRTASDVPLLIPEINSSHLKLLDVQKFSGGKIIATPNCSAIGLAIALKPLHDRFGIEALQVTTMQAISGAGYPGIPSLEIMDNIIPFIEDEENKLESEPLKILGAIQQDRIIPAEMKISAQCNRVPVTDGHLECVSIKFKKKPSREELIEAWRSFKGDLEGILLPLKPEFPIHYFEDEKMPQPRLQRDLDRGMAVSVGHLRECPIFDYKFALLSHNTVRGGAGGAILCAELLVKKGFIFW